MKTPLTLWAALAISLAVSSCSRNEEFGGDLILAKEDSSHVYLYRKGQPHNTIVVDQQIVDILSQDGLLLILRKSAESYDCEEVLGRTIITHYSSNSEYWIVEVAGPGVFGPLKKRDFDEVLERRGILLNRSLQEGSYRSNTAEFESLKANCRSIKPT